MELETINNIIKTKDALTLSNLNEYDMISFLIELVHNHYYDMPFESMNDEIKILFSCWTLENFCQADYILDITEEEALFFNMKETCNALRKINAPKTADELQKFIDIMPEGTFENRVIPAWEWFFEEERKNIIKSINSEISNYPDGLMRGLYHKYIISDINIAKKILDI